MAKAKLSQGKQYAYEEFMRRAEKEKRVRREEISMKALKPDTTLQARVDNINTEHVRSLHELLKNGQELAPIVVFEIAPGKLKIADGFHRHEVYRREGRPAIPCLVITGTLQEAVEYAASCNQVLSLPRKREDIKKAIYMLLENGWLERSSSTIASQVGCSGGTVVKYIASYCAENDINEPDLVVDRGGVIRKKRSRKSDEPYRLQSNKSRGKQPTYSTSVNGERVYLGTNEKAAREKLAALNSKREKTASQIADMGQSLLRRGVAALPISSSEDTTLFFIGGFRTAISAVATWKPASHRDSRGAVKAVAESLLIAAHFSLERKVVVKPSNAPVIQSLIEVAGKLGVEFMTLDEFVASEKDGAQ